MGPDISFHIETKQELVDHPNQIELPVSKKASPKNLKPAATMNLEKFKAEQDVSFARRSHCLQHEKGRYVNVFIKIL
jgi:hypothetical protein